MRKAERDKDGLWSYSEEFNEARAMMRKKYRHNGRTYKLNRGADCKNCPLLIYWECQLFNGENATSECCEWHETLWSRIRNIDITVTVRF